MVRAAFIPLLAVLLPFFVGSAASIAANAPSFFASEQEAQQHCPSDVVVWLNPRSAIYHFKGQRWYGATKYGAYVCKKEADQARARAAGDG